MGRTWEIIGAPYDLSANEAGASKAPGFIRRKFTSLWADRFAKHWDISLRDGGDVIPTFPTDQETNSESALAAFCTTLCERVLKSYEMGNTPLVIGGDHSISVGSVSGAALHVKRRRPESTMGLLWVDAHTDLSPGDGNLHGRVAAILIGIGPASLTNLCGLSPKVLPQDLIEIGIQELWPLERDVIQDGRISIHPMHEVDRRGARHVTAEAISTLEQNTDAFFVSIDIDASQAESFGACAAPKVGGMSARELCAVAELAVASDMFCGMDIVEFCPGKDATGNTGQLVINLLNTVVGFTMLYDGGVPKG